MRIIRPFVVIGLDALLTLWPGCALMLGVTAFLAAAIWAWLVV